MSSREKPSKIIDSYAIYFIVATIISAALLLFSVSPYNETRYSLLNNSQVKIRPEGKEENKELILTSENATVNCNIDDVSKFNVCGIKFVLPINLDKNNVVSFDDRDHLIYHIISSTDTSNPDGKVRLLIKNLHNASAWKKFRGADTKYHAARVEPDGYGITPLENFRVEHWWEKKYAIPSEEAQNDFSKVLEVVIHIEDVPINQPGFYSITVSQLAVHGKKIYKEQLYLFFSYFWPVFILVYFFHYLFVKNRQLKQFAKQAHYDAESNNLNLAGLEALYPIHIGKQGALYLVKITNWRTIEHHFGKESANQLVRNTTTGIEGITPYGQCLCARIENDEFVILTYESANSATVERKLLSRFQEGGCILGSTRVRLQVKIGVVNEAALPSDLDSLILKSYQAVDTILHTSTFVQHYNKHIDEEVQKEAFISDQLELALDSDAFHLVYMPLYSTKSKQYAGAEALIRCTWPALKNIGPDVYIPIAEKFGLIRRIDFWVIRTALATFSANRDRLSPGFVLSINISSKELLDTLFVTYFKTWLAEYDIDATKICLEITETFFVDINEVSSEAIDELHALGCLVSLDDFGTGYTSFVHLMNMLIDEVKIDRLFVNNIHLTSHLAIMNSILSISKANGYKVVAEGVEELSQMKLLAEMGCELFQGYLISKPKPLDQIGQPQDYPEMSEILGEKA